MTAKTETAREFLDRMYHTAPREMTGLDNYHLVVLARGLLARFESEVSKRIQPRLSEKGWENLND